MKDIHPIKPLMALDFPWLAFLFIASLILGVMLLMGWLLWRRLKRKQEVLPEETPPLKVETHTLRAEALAALTQLEKSAAFQSEQGQAVYLELEAIFKRFLEGVHDKPITGYTDQELESFLRKLTHLHWQASGLAELLERSLYARFAKASFSKEQMKADLRLLQQFVQKHITD